MLKPKQESTPAPWKFKVGVFFSIAAMNIIAVFISILPIGMSNDSGAYPLVPVIGMALLVASIIASIVCTVLAALRNSKRLSEIAGFLPFFPIVALIGGGIIYGLLQELLNVF